MKLFCKGEKKEKVGQFLKKHYKLLILLVVLILAGVFGFRYYQQKQRAAAMSQVKKITTEPIERKTLSNTISITGTIAAKDSQTVYSNNQGCEVVSINVKIGDYVSAGDTIAVLDSSDYEDEIAAQEKKRTVAVEKAQLNAEQAARDLAEANADASTDVSRAQEDINDACEDYSAVVDSKSKAYNEYLQACDTTSSAKDTRDTKQAKYKKLKTQLEEDLENGTISKNSVEYETRNAEVTEAKTAYTNADSAVTTAEKNEESLLKTYESYGDKLTSAVRNYESAVEKQQDAGTSAARSVEKSQDSVTSASLDSSTVTDEYDKQIEEYQKQIDKCTVKAAISGVVTSIPMEVGDEISNDNNEICVIQDDSAYLVEATVDQYDISSLYEGMDAVIKTDATDDLEMTGTVTFVSPTPETSSGSSGSGNSGSASGTSSSTTSYPVKIAIKDKDDRLRIGMTAETSVITEQAKDVLAVPYDCISTDKEGNSIIYVMDDGRSQKSILVDTGLETDYYTEIKSDDISEGMLVVVPNSISGTSASDQDESTDKDKAVFSIGGGGMGGNNRGNMGGGGPSGGPSGGPGGF